MRCLHFINFCLLIKSVFFLFAVSASFAPGADANATRQRHAPLYGRLVAEEHLPPAHRDAVHQVNIAGTAEIGRVTSHIRVKYCIETRTLHNALVQVAHMNLQVKKRIYWHMSPSASQPASQSACTAQIIITIIINIISIITM